MTTTEDELDKIIASYIMPASMHNGIDKRAEARVDILAYTIAEKVKMLEELRGVNDAYLDTGVPFNLTEYIESVLAKLQAESKEKEG